MAGRAQISTRNSALIAMIADEDTVVGMLLAGFGNVDLRRKTNYLIVDSKTTVKQIEDAFKEFTTREDIAVVLISQFVSLFFFTLISILNISSSWLTESGHLTPSLTDHGHIKPSSLSKLRETLSKIEETIKTSTKFSSPTMFATCSNPCTWRSFRVQCQAQDVAERVPLDQRWMFDEAEANGPACEH